MGLTYNKEFVSKSSRLSASGPRDRQLKQSSLTTGSGIDIELISDLKSQISSLQSQLRSVATSGYTDDQVNDLIYKSVKEQTASLSDKVLHLETVIASLNEVISAKESTILALKSLIDSNKLTTVISDSHVVVDSRPVINTVYVDPIDSDSDQDMVSFIAVDSQVGETSDTVSDKVNKLKNLLGNKSK
jgi:hypothetical protein